jgi:C_GCAxxG_C_C family probable redox protein
MSDKKKIAVETFNSGCNCAQAVLTSFSDILKMDKESLMAVSAGFGGGMGKLQDTCGAATGAYMVFSIYRSHTTSDNQHAKDESALMIRKFSKRFMEIEGSTNCKKLIGVDLNTEEGQQEAAEKDLFNKVCGKCVSTAVGIVEEMIG